MHNVPDFSERPEVADTPAARGRSLSDGRDAYERHAKDRTIAEAHGERAAQTATANLEKNLDALTKATQALTAPQNAPLLARHWVAYATDPRR